LNQEEEQKKEIWKVQLKLMDWYIRDLQNLQIKVIYSLIDESLENSIYSLMNGWTMKLEICVFNRILQQ